MSDFDFSQPSPAPHSPLALREAAFGEKRQMDLARLSLAQQSELARQTAATQNALYRRAQLTNAIQKNLSAAHGAQQLGSLDVSAKSFDKNVNDIISSNPDALSSPGFTKRLSEIRADRANFVKAETPDILSNPLAAKSFDDHYASTGNATMAANAAKATLSQFNQANKLISSPHLSPDDVSKIYDPQTGQYNLDPGAINQLQIKHDTLERAATVAKENKPDVNTALNFLKTLNPKAPLAELAKPDANDAVGQANYTAWQNARNTLLGATNAPAAAAARTTPATAESEMDKFLGKSSTAPAPAAAPPPAAPAASAAPNLGGGDELAPAPTPTPAPEAQPGL